LFHHITKENDHGVQTKKRDTGTFAHSTATFLRAYQNPMSVGNIHHLFEDFFDVCLRVQSINVLK